MNYGLRQSIGYVDWTAIDPTRRLDIIAVDQEKFNLTWLVFPEIEKEGLDIVPAEFVDSIHTYMDKTTRRMLTGLPLPFTRYWDELEKKGQTLALTIGMPDDYRARMLSQAHKAQARLVHVEGNIITPPFWKAAG